MRQQILQLADVLLSYTYGSIYKLAEGPLMILLLQYLDMWSSLTLQVQTRTG